MVNSSTVQVIGPLLGHVEDLWNELLQRGYTPLSAGNLLRLAAHLSRWLEARRLALEDLNAKHIDAFLHARRRAGYVQFLTPKALKPVLHYLEQAGVVSIPEPKDLPLSPSDQLLQNYSSYLIHERTLTAGVVWQYSDSARRLLASRFGQRPLRLRELNAEDIIAFVLNYSRRHSIGTNKLLVTALRSFLRYLYLQGAVDRDLSGAVPAVAGWRLAGLPKGLSDDEVRRLLCTCDRRTRLGRRSYALLLLMVRLGLRRCEVTALKLDDINWQCGEITVCGKGREDILPLPTDVGEALACHLRSYQPRSQEERCLFPRTRAPYGPLGRGGIGAIVKRHLHLAGVHPSNTHRLRHTAATRMLRRGTSLDNIAQVLRHRSPDTTAIYAKVPWKRSSSHGREGHHEPPR
jgi:site-specific recombinase XerD